MAGRIHYQSLAWDLLQVIGGAAIVASLFVAPNLGIALRPFLKGSASERRIWERRRVRAELQRLRERRYVRFEQRGNKTFLAITERGKQRLHQFEFDTVAFPQRPRRWDKQWRMVIFDIPEEKKRERQVLRDKLNELNFLPLQKSVFVYPYPCEDEIDFLTTFLGIERYIHCIGVHSLGTAEGRARHHFSLL